jgi:putative membrane protein
MAVPDTALPYCGPAPLPGDALARWNLDPVLLGVWIGVLLAHAWATRRTGAPARPERIRFRAGWALALLAWVSPLCALGVALFSARVAQHMLLVLAAAPLLAGGWPRRAEAGVGSACAAVAAFAAATWLWHVPFLYDLTFRSTAAYWAMHASLLASGAALWRVLLARPEGGFAVASAAALASCFAMSLLGAVLTFAPTLLYGSHRLSAVPWGLSPLTDQQLGGLVLWVPGCLAFLLAGVAPVSAWLKLQERRAAQIAL